jgi:general secretion pathway protein G
MLSVLYCYRKKGFTLIELLVVVSIIGLLSTVVLGLLNTERAKARDTSRVQELREIQKALDVYYSIHNSYPVSSGPNNNWVNDCDSGVVFVIPELVSEKLFTGVKDLIPCPYHWGYTYASNGRDYKVIAHSEYSSVKLQNLIDPADDGGPNRCIQDGNNLVHYGIWTDGAACWREGEPFP